MNVRQSFLSKNVEINLPVNDRRQNEKENCTLNPDVISYVSCGSKSTEFRTLRKPLVEKNGPNFQSAIGGKNLQRGKPGDFVKEIVNEERTGPCKIQENSLGIQTSSVESSHSL